MTLDPRTLHIHSQPTENKPQFPLRFYKTLLVCCTLVCLGCMHHFFFFFTLCVDWTIFQIRIVSLEAPQSGDRVHWSRSVFSGATITSARLQILMRCKRKQSVSLGVSFFLSDWFDRVSQLFIGRDWIRFTRSGSVKQTTLPKVVQYISFSQKSRLFEKGTALLFVLQMWFDLFRVSGRLTGVIPNNWTNFSLLNKKSTTVPVSQCTGNDPKTFTTKTS